MSVRASTSSGYQHHQRPSTAAKTAAHHLKIVNNNRQTPAVGAEMFEPSSAIGRRAVPHTGIGDFIAKPYFTGGTFRYWYSLDSFEHPTIRSQGILREAG
jgi:hypothetical protein